jgi:hypothetical protein
MAPTERVDVGDVVVVHRVGFHALRGEVVAVEEYALSFVPMRGPRQEVIVPWGAITSIQVVRSATR